MKTYLRSIVAWCLLALLWPVFSGCAKREARSNPASPSQILRISQRNEPADLDPAKSTLPDDFFVIRALSEGLLVPGPTVSDEPRAAAAKSWEVSPDGLVYTFHLRPDATWSNGEPVTAADFVASYQRLLTPATAAPKAHLFFAVKNAQAFATGQLQDFSAVGFRAVDPTTFAITLERPAPCFLRYVASGPWIPVNPRAVAKHGRNWTRPENFVGNGAFALAEWRPHQRIVVRKNPAYHEASQVRLEEIQFIAFDNGDAEERAYRAGQIDVTMDVPKTKIETYARERPVELHQTPLAETRYLSFNTQRPPLNDPNVRRALAGAIDRTRIVQLVLRGEQRPTEQFWNFDRLPPKDSKREFANMSEPFPSAAFSPARAKQNFARVGFGPAKTFPRLELSGWAQSQIPVLETMQAMWKETLGIEVVLVVRDAKVHVAALQSGDYDIGFITSIPDVADETDVLDNFVTGVPGNYPHWSSPDFDLWVGRATTAPSRADRLASLKKASDILDETCPVAPLYFNTKNWLMSPRVHGWQEDALWTRYYQNIYLDEKSPSVSSSIPR